MMNNRQQRGYSLVELSFVLIIMLVLAGIVSGAGAFMSNQAKGQKLSDKARELFVAANHRHAKVDSFSKPVSGNTAVLVADLSAYMDSNTTAYADPYTGITKYAIAASIFAQADYPTNVKNWASLTGAKVLYFHNPGPSTTFDIYDQDHGITNPMTFKFFAFQAIDNDGRATVTIGK